MRKLAFVKIPDKIQKLMIYHYPAEGVYLFGYDCRQDTSCTWDSYYESVEDAEEHCRDVYHVSSNDWIAIADPCDECQHDFINKVRVKKQDAGPQWKHFEVFENGKWMEWPAINRCDSFDGLTANERLFVSGLMHEFDEASKSDKKKILSALDAE